MPERKMNGNKCSDFSIDSLLKSETRRRKHPDTSPVYQHTKTREEMKLKNCEILNGPENKLNQTRKNQRQAALSSSRVEISSQELEVEMESQTLSWLNCTRFNPPKVTRSRKRGSTSAQERRTGRGPRIPFCPRQIAVLENTFTNSRYLSSDSIATLASALDLTNDRVKIWFQNRRARFKRDRAATTAPPQDQRPISLTNKSIAGHSHYLNVVAPDKFPSFFFKESPFLPQLSQRIIHA